MSAIETPTSETKLPGLRSLKFTILARNLSLALLFGGVAALLNLYLLYSPLEQNERAIAQSHELQLGQSLHARFAAAQDLSVLLNATVQSVWGQRQRITELGQTLLANAEQDPALIGALLWSDPRYFTSKPPCGSSGDWLEVCPPQQRHDVPARMQSIYWRKPAASDATTSQAQASGLAVARVEQDTHPWFGPLGHFKPRGCFWLGPMYEPYLDRAVLACLIPVRRQEKLVGVSGVLLDPQKIALPRSAQDQSDYVLLSPDQTVLATTLEDGDGATSLTDLAAALPHMQPLLSDIEADQQRRLQQARSVFPDWQSRFVSLIPDTGAESAGQMEHTLARLALGDIAQPVAGLQTRDNGSLMRYAVGHAGELLAIRPAPQRIGGLTLRAWKALAASAGLLILALLAYQFLTSRLAVSPLRRLIRQLVQEPQTELAERGGCAEINELRQQMNLRQTRIIELLKRRNDSAISAPSEVATAKDSDAGWGVVDALPDGVVLTNGSGQIDYLNRIAEAFCGRNLAQVQNQSFDEVFALYDRRGKHRLSRLAQGVAERSGGREEPPLFALLRDPQQRDIAVAISRRSLKSSSDTQPSVVIVIHMLGGSQTAGAANDSELDPVTGARNRLSFDVDLQARCEAASAENSSFALLYLDSDQIKELNQTLGREAGNEFLRQLARLIQSDVGDSSPVYRLHGDKFAVLLNAADPAEAQVVAELLRADISSWQFEHEGRQHHASVSIGLVHAGAHSGRPVDILRQASELAQQAQKQGGARVVASRIEPRHSSSRDDNGWLGRLEHGLAQDQLCLATRKIQPLHSGQESSLAFEALLSLEEDDNDQLPAAKFMPSIARHEIAEQIDRWTVARVFHHLAQEPSIAQAMDFTMVPLSLRSMQSPHFLDFLFEHLQSTGIAPGKICFDLTESEVQTQISNVLSFCQTLSQVGCRLSLSGVSTRPGSYDVIKQLPVQIVRFDPLLTRQIDKDAVERLATESLHRIVSTLGKQSMLTQVKSDAVLKLAQKMGIHYVQGDAVAKPVSRPFSDANA